MSKRVPQPLVPAVSVGLFVAVIVFGADRTAVAANDCLAGPDRPPAPGGHWYYHLDHASDRKCWYLVEPEARVPAAEAVPPQPAPEPPPAPQPGFGAFFSTLSAGFPGSTAAPPPTPDAHGPQTAPADGLKNTEAAPARDLHPARRPAAVAALAPKPHQPRPPVAHPDEHAAASSDQAERDALFQEFLRWRERQTP
jgi:hypothetical protein